jgi:hypothetical protein
MAHVGSPLDGAAAARAWPRLLLWVFACAALVVSLSIRADGPGGRDPGLAARATAANGLFETRLPLLGALIREGQPGALSVKSGPRG